MKYMYSFYYDMCIYEVFFFYPRNPWNPEARRIQNPKAVRILTTVENGTTGSGRHQLLLYISPPLHKVDQTLAYPHPYRTWQLCPLTWTSLGCPGYLVAAAVVVTTVALRTTPLPHTASGATLTPPPQRLPQGATSD
jgi:hypothetical protein